MPAAAREASGVVRDGASPARPRGNVALAPASADSVKNWIDISILVASVVSLWMYLDGG
jgi:hypothetical protein